MMSTILRCLNFVLVYQLRLGERNCVEIVAKLISTKLLDVVFTTDGKEYVTPEHLTKELKDEAYVQGGMYIVLIFEFK